MGQFGRKYGAFLAIRGWGFQPRSREPKGFKLQKSTKIQTRQAPPGNASAFSVFLGDGFQPPSPRLSNTDEAVRNRRPPPKYHSGNEKN
jgi:hypothetical protein